MNPRRSSRSTRDPSELRFALWNVEWMNDLFVADSDHAGGSPPGSLRRAAGSARR